MVEMDVGTLLGYVKETLVLFGLWNIVSAAFLAVIILTVVSYVLKTLRS